ncbi:hypothetical protein [Tsukamurella paurometabola]|uniref:Secreted protein n=1 Tax=Tsukamurella paurometabola TaxID=2061 RepID=A0ABS5NH41_TSUPA|nr:hypothetical protein [Tsukamurella paurometabola]MBS4102937.1 hypothetical protein [Tsukamurella paurometabola]
MDKNKLIPVAAALAAATILTACDTTTSGEPVATPSTPASAAPSSTTFANAADAADADRAARARAGLPNSGSLTLEDAETAVRRGLPFVFGAGRGCAWVRLPDGSLWALHDNRSGSPALTRDVGTEAAWRADPDFEPGRCEPAEGIPTADDPAQPEPYRWTADYGNQYLRWHGQVYILPGTVSAGLALTPIVGETIPGVNGVPIPN